MGENMKVWKCESVKVWKCESVKEQPGVSVRRKAVQCEGCEYQSLQSLQSVYRTLQYIFQPTSTSILPAVIILSINQLIIQSSSLYVLSERRFRRPRWRCGEDDQMVTHVSKANTAGDAEKARCVDVRCIGHWLKQEGRRKERKERKERRRHRTVREPI